MTSKIIRQKFLDFFQSKQHQIVPSAPIVVKNDPTLMFTNAGMNQFKDYFLGNAIPSSKRIADTQKCLRVSGKHNDLEDVGHDTYHHTMFEMLGNWSFGDYFKKESLEWAWELLTEVYQLPKDRLYVSVFGGDEKENMPLDTEAYDIWRAMVPEDKIIYGSKKDNFWEMGDTGPCGPCSEIHIDLRPQAEVDLVPGKDLVNNDHPQVIEIWNNVFIQFNRLANGSLENLPDKHVDTGMGFERLVRAVQWKHSNYDTDVFQHSIAFIAETCGKKYGENEQVDVAMRVIADHIRAVAFAIADGQLPSNNKAGYVIRRILRRAVRYAYTFLDLKEPFFFKLVALLAEQFDGVFPELIAQEAFVTRVILEEEITFLKTLETGLNKLEEISNSTAVKSSLRIDGKTVFELYDTFGFPVDLTALIAREKGLTIDEAGFELEMEQQKARSKNAASLETGDWITLKDIDQVTFVGYDQLTALSVISKYREIKSKGKSQFQLVLETTPFYGESGGQIGDTGYLECNGIKTIITDTKKENDLIVLLTDKLPENLAAEFTCVVDKARRTSIENNHSVTHLLHAALKQVLGAHVNQKGSLVNVDLLRFDFSHFTKVSDEELAMVERIVNEKIKENISLSERRNVPIADAKSLGAMALFGEKYGDFVRVITFDQQYSVELCGGTHAKATGQIGLFKIIAESSVATGVRRIEAVSATAAENYVNAELSTLNEVRAVLKNPKELVKTIESLVEEKNNLQKQLEAFQAVALQDLKQQLLTQVSNKDGVNYLFGEVKVHSADALKSLAFELKAKVENLYCVLAAEIEAKPQLAVMLSDDLVTTKNLNAVAIIKDLAKEIQGGGGGQPFFATAGGKDLSGLSRAIAKAALVK
jgi:alanyl-tRNA synthetase